MNKQQKLVIFTAIGMILFFVIAGYIYNTQQSSTLSNMAKEEREVFIRDYSISLGNEDAKVQLVEWFDPACGTCAQFYPLVKDLMKKHDGNIRLILRYAPYHPGSDKVLLLLEAARKQGMFWQTLEMLFATQSYWTKNHVAHADIVWQFLPKIGIDMEKLSQDIKDPELARRISQDLADAKKVGASKTPAYYANGKPLQKFGWEELVELVESEL